MNETSAHVDRWALWSWLAPTLVVLTMLAATMTERTLYKETMTVSDTEPGTSAPFTMPRTRFGGVRISAEATLQWQTWAALQVSVVDANGESLLDVVKETWAETGIWYEGGESGTWSERDTQLAWDLRAGAAEEVRLNVTVLETGQADGALREFPVVVTVRVTAGLVDFRLLGIALALATAFATLATFAAAHGGRPVIVERSDGELQGRAAMGGPGHLVAVSVTGLVDETAPGFMKVRLIVRDDAGNQLYDRNHGAEVKFRRSEGEIEDGRFAIRLYLETPRAASYGFFVQVTPDSPIEWVKLIVRDRATTLRAVTVTPLVSPEPKT